MKRVEIYRGWCKKCGICIAFCPKHALEADKDSFPVVNDIEQCSGCRICEMRCPDFAIVVFKNEDREGRTAETGEADPDSSAG
jgi:2-oxoglutarate ferredoxin oxidoreductase subunit delta